jgi:GDP-L-fucose synthase
MTVLVTGGSGMVGRHLQDIAPDYIYLSSADCDLTSYKEVDLLMKKYQPTAVIHLAAKVGGILQNMKFPADFYDLNIAMNTNVLKAARDNKINKFLSILSTCMYPNVVETYPLTEEDVHKGPPAQANFSYAYTKRCMAVQIEAYNQQLGCDYNYLIPCNLYGEYDNFDDSNKMHFVTALINKIITAENNNEKSITLFGSGTPLRQFMYSGDLAKVIKLVMDNDIKESFNVAPTNQNYSIDQMARMTLDALNKKDWTIEYDSTKPDGQFRKDVSNLKMLNNIADFKFTEFSDGVVKVYNKIKERGV